MRSHVRVGLLVLLGWLPSCGGSGDGGVVVDLQALADCATARFDQFGVLLTLLRDLVEEVQGADLATITIAPGMQPNSYNYSASIDLDGDGTPETTAFGTIGFSADPTDGIAEGDQIGLRVVSLNGGPVTGSANFQCVAQAGDVVRISPGIATVSAAGTCTVEITATDLTAPLVVDAIPVGTVEFSLTSGSATLEATLTLDGSATASIDGTVNGTVPVQFEVTLVD